MGEERTPAAPVNPSRPAHIGDSHERQRVARALSTPQAPQPGAGGADEQAAAGEEGERARRVCEGVATGADRRVRCAHATARCVWERDPGGPGSRAVAGLRPASAEHGAGQRANCSAQPARARNPWARAGRAPRRARGWVVESARRREVQSA